MQKHFIVLLLSILVLGCQSDKIQVSNLISLAPKNASYIIRSTNLEALRSGLTHNHLIQELVNYKELQNIQQQLQILKPIDADQTFILSLGKDSKDSLQFSFITKFSKSLFAIDSLPNKMVETYQSQNSTITKTTINSQILYSTIIDSIFFGSNQKELVENALLLEPNDSELQNIYETASDKHTLSILINSKVSDKKQLPIFNTKALQNAHLSNYFLLDTEISQDELLLTGITKATDSSKSLINIFKNNIPQENLIAKLCPPETDAFLSFTLSNFNTFQEQLSAFKAQDSLTQSAIFDNISEFGVINQSDSEAIIMRSIDVNSTIEATGFKPSDESYRDIEIFNFDNSKLFHQNLYPLISSQSAAHFVILDDFLVFSNSVEFLKSIISSYQNNFNLYESDAYQSLMKQMNNESSLFLFANDYQLGNALNTAFSETLALKNSAYKASAIQFIYDTDFAHVNALFQKHKQKAAYNSVTEERIISLDNDLLIDPQLVVDYTSQEKDIVVQDVKNNLYQITNDGKILYKIQLDGKILGEISQIDLYKNGRLQLIFNTSKRVYVIDRSGKEVQPFPLKFNDDITLPISVFDYDNKRDYRILVTQGKNLLMYDKHGKIVTGFTYKKAESDLNIAPQHFRIGKRDYIVFTQGQKVEILDRVGKTRIPVKTKFDFSDKIATLYDGKFTLTTADGKLVQINESGHVETLDLNLSERHHMTATSKTLVTLAENRLSIKLKTIELDFGDYTEPKLYYVNDKIYVATTDLQTNKAYLFDSQTKPIDHFPVFGNSTAIVANINNRPSIEVITKGESNSIIIYKIN